MTMWQNPKPINLPPGIRPLTEEDRIKLRRDGISFSRHLTDAEVDVLMTQVYPTKNSQPRGAVTHSHPEAATTPLPADDPPAANPDATEGEEPNFMD